MNIFKRLKCNHEFVTVSNFYGDYIIYISASMKHIYRSRQVCKHCGKQRLSEHLDKNCKVINDGTMEV